VATAPAAGTTVWGVPGRSNRPTLRIGRCIGSSGRQARIQNPKLPRRRLMQEFHHPGARQVHSSTLAPKPALFHRRPARPSRLRIADHELIELPALSKSDRISQEAETARVPPDGILGSQAKGGSHLAFVDGVVGRRSQQQRIGIACGLRPVHDHIPAAVPGLLRLNRQQSKYPPLSEWLPPLLSGIHFPLKDDLPAACRVSRGGKAQNRGRGGKKERAPKPRPARAPNHFHRRALPSSELAPKALSP
jgi:hypothetical protein